MWLCCCSITSSCGSDSIGFGGPAKQNMLIYIFRQKTDEIFSNVVWYWFHPLSWTTGDDLSLYSGSFLLSPSMLASEMLEFSTFLAMHLTIVLSTVLLRLLLSSKIFPDHQKENPVHLGKRQAKSKRDDTSQEETHYSKWNVACTQ